MHTVELYAYGRSTAQGKWFIDRSRIVNRLYLVNRGSATVHIGGKEWKLTEGHFYILGQSADFAPIAAEGFDHTYFDYYSTRILRADRIVETELSMLGASHFLHFINAAIASEGSGKHDAVQALLTGFLSLIEDALPDAAFISNPILIHALARIHSDFATVSTKSLAAELHLCESYFIRLFRKALGLTPHQYVRAHRVLRGKQLLSAGESVEAAAEACGYASASAFYKAVRAETQKAPSALKRK